MVKIAICEDDPIQRRNLVRMAEAWGAGRNLKNVVFPYANCEAFLTDWMGKMDFDLCLLDIDLGPGQNGMELAKLIRQKDERIGILFITGLPEYMGQGYDVGACHFLVKPVEAGRMAAVLDKALARMEKKEDFLLLQEETEAECIPISRILYGEAFSHTVALYLAPEAGWENSGCPSSVGRREVKMCLGDLEELLPKSEFFRCHRSYLAHLPYIRRIDKTQAALDYGISIPVSRGKRGELYQAFLAYYRKTEY